MYLYFPAQGSSLLWSQVQAAQLPSESNNVKASPTYHGKNFFSLRVTENPAASGPTPKSKQLQARAEMVRSHWDVFPPTWSSPATGPHFGMWLWLLIEGLPFTHHLR